MFYQGDTLVPEINPADKLLAFLYKNITGKLLRRVLRHRLLHRLIDHYYSSRLSRRHIQPFIKHYAIDMREYQQPATGYTSFNDFFARTLVPGARAINQEPHRIASPADSKLLVIPNLATDTLFTIKHKQFDLKKFFGSAALAYEFAGGTMMIFRLAPGDYHWFHFPVDCTPAAPRVINGLFESVNPSVFAAGVNPLTDNERHLIMLSTERFGHVAMLAVGAMIVGKIVETYTPNTPQRTGAPAGYFALGGSTVVLVFHKNAVSARQSFVQHSLQGYESAVKMGEAVTE